MKYKHLLTYLAMTLALVLIMTSTASSQDGASVELSATTEDTAYEYIQLTISGPNSFTWDGIFEAGKAPAIGLTLPDGTVLPDGQFTYELLYVPSLSADTLKIMADAQNDAERAQLEAELRASGAIPPTRIQTGSFLIEKGMLVSADDASETDSDNRPSPSNLDQQILDDLIVVGSICAGQDCTNGESFGFDTIRLKENNLRIRFQDTSTSASFPSNDWEITVNDSDNGGQNKFSITDIDGGRVPFTLEASAPSHSLYVDDGGRIGLGTSTPVVEAHMVSGDSPTIRLEQDGSSGFTAQTWDVASNEANFFVRDVTNGSKLPFRIQPNSPQNSLYIENTGEIGLGTQTPDASLHVIGDLLVTESDSGALANQASLHVQRTDGTASLTIEEAGTSLASRTLLTLRNNGSSTLSMQNSSNGNTWNMVSDTSFSILKEGSGGLSPAEFVLTSGGNLTLGSSLTIVGGGGCTGCFASDNADFASVDVLAQIKNLPIGMWTSEYEPARPQTSVQPDVAAFNSAFGVGYDLKHIAPLDVATVALAAAQELAVEQDAQSERIAELEAQNTDLEQRIADLEALVEAMLEADSK